MKKLTLGASIDRRGFVVGAAGIGAMAMTASLPLLSGCGPRQTETIEEDAGNFDIIIVGAGGAGMTAAIGAYEAGANVVLLEKMSAVGGNTHFAEGGMNASETSVQKREGVEDSNDLFISDTYRGGYELGNMELITYLCTHSNAAFVRLEERGMYLGRLGTSGGASVPRFHRPEDGSAVGAYLVEHLTALCRGYGIKTYTNMDVQEILIENEKVVGVRAQNGAKSIFYYAPAVILTTGGFGANHEKLAEYRPELLHVITTNQPGSQGDGVEMGIAVGADTVDMKEIQVHPTVEQSSGILLSESIRGDGAVLVNSDGNRFINELLTRDVVTAAEWEQPGGWAYAVFDQKAYEVTGSVETKFVENDLVLIADTFEELAELMEVDTATFVATMNAYNDAINSGTEDPLGRTASRKLIDVAPFYAIRVAPGIHHTMGGLRIDVNTRVLSADLVPIEGLFAAGEVAGGVHGGNRLGGNAVLDLNVFGHHAAEVALEFIGIT